MIWHPIETAPKDDYETLLVFDLDIGVCLGYWSPSNDGFPGCWMAQDSVGEYCGDLTHWQPLPPPPEVTP